MIRDLFFWRGGKGGGYFWFGDGRVSSVCYVVLVIWVWRDAGLLRGGLFVLLG